MKKISKNLIFIACMMIVLGSSFTTFATDVNSNDTKRSKINGVNTENADMIIGKITNIDAEKVTVEVVTRKEKEKKHTSTNVVENNQIERKKPSAEDKYVLTGESKTYSISSTDFGRKKVEKTDTEKTDDSNKNTKGEKMTYADYKVGDYVRITVNKDTPEVAKRMRNADEDFNYKGNGKGNYKGGYKGSYTGKTKAEKDTN